MKKFIIKISIMISFTITIVILSILSLNTFSNSESHYIPNTDFNNDEDQSDDISFIGYSQVDLTYQNYPIYDNSITTDLYYDNIDSYYSYDVTEIPLVKIGDKVKPNDNIGVNDVIIVKCEYDGIVVEATNEKIIIKVISNVYVKFTMNLYDTVQYQVGDIFDVYKNNIVVTTGIITHIDYQNIVNDKLDVVVKINNDDLYFQTITNVTLVKQGYIISSLLSFESSYVGISNSTLNYTNKIVNGIYRYNGVSHVVSIRIGYTFNGYCEIREIIYNGTSLQYSGGVLYVENYN